MARTINVDLRENYQQNYIINGSVDFWQRGDSFTSITTSLYTADRFRFVRQSTSVYSLARTTDTPNNDSLFAMQVDTTTAGAPAATNIDTIQYNMEGYDFNAIYETSATLSFWVKSNLTGIYSVGLRNDAIDTSYVTEYTINSADTWEKKSIVIDFNAPGVWNFINGRGLIIDFVLASDRNTSSLDQWISGDLVGSTNQVNLGSSTSNNFKLAQIQMTKGSEDLPFRRAGDTRAGELKLCERYYEKTYTIDAPPGTPSSFDRNSLFINAAGNWTSNDRFYCPFKTRKRTNSTILVYAASSGNVNNVSSAGALDVSANVGVNGSTGFELVLNAGADGIFFHWVADSEI